MATKKRVILLGEAALVAEYAVHCKSEGLAPSIRINRGTGTIKLPKGIRKVAHAPKTANLGVELTNIDHALKRKNLVELDRALPRNLTILSSSVTVSLGEQSTWVSHPGRLVGIGALPSLLDGGLIEFARSHHTQSSALKAAERFAADIGKKSAVVSDTVGMVLPRIICSLANEACFAIMEGVAGGKEIDTAMKLGTNYPQGPVEWAARIGVDQVYAVVAALYRFFGEDRYRPSPFLRIAAQNGSFSFKG